MLKITGLTGGYQSMQILFDIDLAVKKGESIALIGRNGVGKTTLLQTIMGILSPFGGEIKFTSEPGKEPLSLETLPVYKIAKAGIGWVPEGRHIFPNLSVRENLEVVTSRTSQESYWTIDRVYELFPKLSERVDNMGNQLSGGEQQMLAIARALLTNPRLLLLDEATEGLAPAIRHEIWRILGILQDRLTLIIVGRNLRELSKVVKKLVVMEKGRIVYEGADLKTATEKISL